MVKENFFITSFKISGAHTESSRYRPRFSFKTAINHFLWPGPDKSRSNLSLVLRMLLRSRSIQPDVVEEHLAGTAGHRHITPGSHADCDPVDIG